MRLWWQVSVQEAAVQKEVSVQQTRMPLEPKLVGGNRASRRRGRQRQQQPLGEKTDEGVPEILNHTGDHGWSLHLKHFLMPRADQMPVGQGPWRIRAQLTLRDGRQVVLGLLGLRPLTTGNDGNDVTPLVGLKPLHARKHRGEHGASAELWHIEMLGNSLPTPALHNALKMPRDGPGAELKEREAANALVREN
jgi:hypothetical protein